MRCFKWRSSQKKTAHTVNEVWVVPTTDGRDLSHIAKAAVLNPELMEELPPGFLDDAFIIVDCMVPRETLGIGVFKFVTMYGARATIGSTPPPAAAPLPSADIAASSGVEAAPSRVPERPHSVMSACFIM